MKKISLILVLLMVFSVFATACGGDSETSTVESEASEQSQTQEKPISTRTGIPVRENPDATVVSTGASYSSNLQADESYADTYGTELTNGIRCTPVSASYGDESLAGYPAAGGRFRIVVDLGYVCEKLYEFRVGYLSTTEAGINKPSSVSIHVSIDGKKWDNIGICKMPDFIEGNIQEAVLQCKDYIQARYIRFYVQSSAAWVMLDEVMAIADIEGGESNSAFSDAVNLAYKTYGAIARPEGTKEIDFDLTKHLVSKNAKYTVTGEQVDTFKDNGKMLTDGEMTGYYEGQTWVGFKGGSDITVKIDLGANVTDIAEIEASFYTNTSVKIHLPVALKIAAIDNDGNKTDLSILYANTIITNGSYVFSMPLDKAIAARYIEVTMIATDCSMHLVEEIGVYTYRDIKAPQMYPDVVLEDNATEWGSEASSNNVNLISGKTQQIISAGTLDESLFANNTKADSKILTDGKISTATDIHNGFFFKFSHGGGRKVIYDLEHISAVNKVTARFTQQIDWGVHAPANVQICVSINGSDWYELGVVEKPGNEETTVFDYELKLSGKVKARYIMFNFTVGAWAGCDEMQVFGTTSVSGAKEPSAYKKVSALSSKRVEPSDDLLGGAKDLCLLYQRNDAQYTVDELIPYLAYVDENGEQKDTMFDSFLFLFLGNFPIGGGEAYQNGTKAGWDWAIEDAFKEGQNLNALEEAAGIVKSNLGLGSDFKYKVTLTLYYPSFGITNFGDADGDGVNEDFSKLEDRLKAIKYHIAQMEEKFEAAKFENIELVGYYWFHETIESKDTESLEMLNGIADIVHKTGKDFFWIPYFCSNGYSDWSNYGFDVAVMQPNYVFKIDTPYSNLITNSALTELYGMGVEMEICYEALSKRDFFKKYMEYVAGGVEYGYMKDTIVMYYQDVLDYYDACYSGTVMGRMIYDYTYHFIKEDLDYNPDALPPITAEVEKNTPYVGKFNFENDYLREIKIAVYPDHGTVTVNSDGTFVFYPETDYTGEVKFSFAYSEYLGWSDPCEVTVTVK